MLIFLVLHVMANAIYHNILLHVNITIGVGYSCSRHNILIENVISFPINSSFREIDFLYLQKRCLVFSHLRFMKLKIGHQKFRCTFLWQNCHTWKRFIASCSRQKASIRMYSYFALSILFTG